MKIAQVSLSFSLSYEKLPLSSFWLDEFYWTATEVSF